MAGNKNSGRKIWRDSQREQMIYTKAVMVILRFLSDKDISLKDKAQMSKDIFMKSMPVSQEPVVIQPHDLAKEALKEGMEFLNGIEV